MEYRSLAGRENKGGILFEISPILFDSPTYHIMADLKPFPIYFSFKQTVLWGSNQKKCTTISCES